MTAATGRTGGPANGSTADGAGGFLPAVDDDLTTRLRRLASALRRIQPRNSRPGARLWRAGAAVLFVGLLAVVIGWWGAAGSAREFEQIPYLISGGMLGLALVVVGSMLCVVAWLSRLIAAVTRLSATLDRTATGTPVDPATAFGQGGPVMTQTGSLVHRPECRTVVGRRVRPAPPQLDDSDLCRICMPGIARGAR